MKKLIVATTVALAMGLIAAPPPGGKGKANKAPASQQKRVVVGRPSTTAHPKAARPQTHKVQIQGSHRQMHARGAGGFVTPPHHHGFHAGRPHGARFWGRPGIPPVMAGALYGWSWVASPWSYTIDGVYYYGEGYYFDGYNYCYNGGFHLVPPPVQVVQPAVVAPAPVVVPAQPTVVVPQQPVVVPAQPAVVTPPVQTVVTPATTVVTPPPPPPPPPRRRGLLDLIFGD